MPDPLATIRQALQQIASGRRYAGARDIVYEALAAVDEAERREETLKTEAQSHYQIGWDEAIETTLKLKRHELDEYRERYGPMIAHTVERAEAAEAALRLIEFGSCDACGHGEFCLWCTSRDDDRDYEVREREHRSNCPVAAALRNDSVAMDKSRTSPSPDSPETPDLQEKD
jgi:hypothetical protein